MKREFEVKCKNCGKIFIVIEEETKFPIKGDKYFCCRSCANTRHHSEETKQKISNSVKTSEKFLIGNSINKNVNSCFLNIEDIPKRICKYCKHEFLPKYIYNGFYYKIIDNNKYCSTECRHKFKVENCIEVNKKYNLGGFKEGSVRNYKSGWYHGIHCDSSWELAFVIYCEDHNFIIERYKEERFYILDNIKYKYYPDFIVNNKDIYEIKGIRSKNSEAKQLYNKDIKFLYKNDMKLYLDYVINIYGNNFINLYDKKDKK